MCRDFQVCVLDQENSKNFIRGKGKEKYNFFLKATEIETVLLRINKVSEAATRAPRVPTGKDERFFLQAN